MHRHHASRETLTTKMTVYLICSALCVRYDHGCRDQSRKSEPVLGCGEQRPRRRDAETRPAAYRGCRSACSRPGQPTFPSLVHSHKRSPPPQPPPPTREFPLYHPSPPHPTTRDRRQQNIVTRDTINV